MDSIAGMLQIKMHKKLLILTTIILILISGCSKPETKEEKIITFTIPEEKTDDFKSYSIEGEENPKVWLIKTRDKRNELNKQRYFKNFEDEEKDRLIDKRTRRWVRIIDGKLVVGYDKEEDELFYKFKETEELKQD